MNMKKILLILMAFICCVNVAYSRTIKVTAIALGEGNDGKAFNGGGTVQVWTASYSRWGWNDYATNGVGTSSSCNSSEADINWGITHIKNGIKYKMQAIPADGYYFSHWTQTNSLSSNNIVNTSADYPETETTYGQGPTEYTYYAIFKQVQINLVTPESAVLETNDLNKTSDATFVFNVVKVDNLNDIAYSLQPHDGATGFSIVEGPTLNATDNTITFKVRYTNDGVHNPDGNPERKATLTLSSKPGKNSKSVTITAKSNLQVDFTTNPDGKLNFTPDEPMNQGEERTKTITTTAVTTTANHATWHVAFEDPEEAALIGYSLVTDPTDKNPEVKFTAPDVNMAGIKTNLIITATYTSTNGIKITKSKTIELSANVGRVITINGYSESDLVFDLDYSNSDTYTTQNAVLYSTLDLNDVTLEEPENFRFPADNSIKYDWTQGATNIAISAKSNITPGQYKVKLLAAVSDIQATLNIDVNVRLAKPVVTPTTGLGNAVLLSWESIYGASMYAVYSGETLIATTTNTSYNVTEVGGNALDDRDYLFMVKAIYNDDEEHFATRASDEILVTPSVAQVIDKNNYSFVEIYTGTECPSETFPYKPKQRIDFSSCFDAAGNPLFDKLYIFGLTSNNNAITTLYEEQVYPAVNIPTNPDKATTCFNAKTPLYVYTKDGSAYQLEQTVDATKTRFDHGTSLNGKKIYITGYCPFAYMGTTANEEGWMYFKGNTSVDIYLDNCTIGGRYKTVNGCGREGDYSDFELELGLGNNYIVGCSSPFVFTSSATQEGTSFKPNIHIKGNSLLMGQTGMRISNVVGKVLFIEIDAGISNVYQSSAPITIRATKNSGYTNLTFDDYWADGTITNGYLKLSTLYDSDNSGIYPCAKVGSIDLGNDAGSVTFNGGQYCLRNGHADGTYSTNMAISYKMFSKTAAGQTIYLYGFGGDQGGGSVTINSGTFTKVKQTISQGPEYYRDQDKFTDLRFPGNTIINGGTFNGLESVVACANANSQGTNPKSGYGDALCLFTGVNPSGNTSYGTKTFRFDDPSFNPIDFIGTDENPLYGDAEAIVTDLRDGLQSVVEGLYYGAQSLNADEEGKLNLLLPLPALDINTGKPWCEVLDNSRIMQWVACVPEFSAGSQGQGVSTGGDVTVEKEIDGVSIKNNQLLYLETNDAILDPDVFIEEGQMTITAQTTRANVENAEDYVIQKHLNLVKAIEADKWITFVAPFDIQQVTVLEHSSIVSEATLAKLSKQEAVLRQAKAYLQMFYAMSDFILPDANGRTTSNTMHGLLYQMKPETLTHYDGTNIREAHYYLYELDNLNVDGSFSSSATGENLEITWKPVGPVEEGYTIMKKGHVYAMQFPYCPLCGDEDTRTTYDYWSGKYIWFYGKGPQTISGSNAQTAMKTNALSPGTAILKGNSTFKNMSLSAGSAYVHNTSNDLFETKNTTYSAKPLEVFMFYNPLAARMPKAISRAGKMIYEDQTATALPTIGDRTTLNAYADHMQIHLTALQAQRVVIYDMHGQVLFDGQLSEGEQMSISAPQGIYIVKGTYEIIKLIVD